MFPECSFVRDSISREFYELVQPSLFCSRIIDISRNSSWFHLNVNINSENGSMLQVNLFLQIIKNQAPVLTMLGYVDINKKTLKGVCIILAVHILQNLSNVIV